MQIAIITRVSLVVGLISLGLSQLRADELKESTSLRFAPKSASFYTTTLRLQEQWERFASSKAYARLRSLPIVQKVITEAHDEFNQSDDEKLEKFKEFLTSPDNQNLIKVAHDAFAHEIFAFGDENFGRALGILNDVNRRVSNIQLVAARDGNAKELEVKKQILNHLIESLDKIQVPRFVIGFRTTLPLLAQAELERAKAELQMLTSEIDELRGRITEVNEGDSRFVVLRLDGSQIPWDKAVDDEPELAAEIQRLRDKLYDRQVKIALGLFDSYIVLVVTPDDDVTSCFEAKELLYETPEFARLRSYAERRMVSIGYASDEFVKEMSNPKEDVQQITLVADAVLPKLDIDEKMADSIRADVKKLVGDLQSLIPTPGAMLSFSFLTENGYEGYTENWAENLFVNTSEPLSILQHTGGNPIAVVACNSKLKPEKMMLQWLDRTAFYVQEIVLKEQLDEEQWDLYVQVRDRLLPILQEYRQVTEDHWNKAFESGQTAFVVDSALGAKPSWHLFMPPSREPLPMIELAWVTPLTNRSELEQALDGYEKVQERLLAAIKELVQEHQADLMQVLQGPAQMAPMMLQNMQVTKPLERSIEDGIIRYRPTLQQALVDAAIAPNFGWNSVAFAYSLSPETTERVLQVQEITGPLAKAEGKDLGSASYVDVSRLIGVFRPWVTYGLDMAKKHGPADQIEEIAPQVDTLLEIMQCYHRYYSITLEGNNSLVTHSRSDFRDLN